MLQSGTIRENFSGYAWFFFHYCNLLEISNCARWVTWYEYFLRAASDSLLVRRAAHVVARILLLGVDDGESAAQHFESVFLHFPICWSRHAGIRTSKIKCSQNYVHKPEKVIMNWPTTLNFSDSTIGSSPLYQAMVDGMYDLTWQLRVMSSPTG